MSAVPNRANAKSLNTIPANAEPLNTIKIDGDPSIPTRYRWAFDGVLNRANGQRVKLPTWKRAGRRVTTPEAVDWFFFELNADADAEKGDTAKEANRRAEAADLALQSLGF